MSKTLALVLAAVTAALVSYIALFERTSLTSKELDERKARVLKAFVRPKVDRLEIQRKGKSVVLERTPTEGGELGPWKMLAPEKVEADEDAIDQVLGELEWLSARRTLENLSESDQKAFGLSNPRYRVTYRAGDEEHVLHVGNLDVHGEGVYARVDREPVAFVVPKTLTEALDHGPGHYRDKEFLGEMTIAWAKRIELTGEDGARTEAVKEGGRFWVLGQPKTYADPKRVDQLLSALDDLRAVRFLEPHEIAAGGAKLAKPPSTLRVSIVPDEAREDKRPMQVELQLYGACPGHEGERYARAGKDGAPVCIKDEDAKSFEIGAGDLRLSRLFSADPSEIEGFELKRGKDALSYARASENWVSASKDPADRAAVEQWLNDLASERATGFVSSGPLAEQGSLVLTLAGNKTERLAIGAPGEDGSVLVKRGDEPALVRFPPGTALLLEPERKRFTSLEPWSAHKPSEVTSLSVEEGGKKRALVLSEGTWRDRPGAPEVADIHAVRELVRQLVKLRVRAFVSAGARPEQGLMKPSARLSLHTASDAALTLELGAKSAHGAYARVDGSAVYEVEPAVLAQLQQLAGTAKAAIAPVEGDAGAEQEHEHAHE